MVSEGHTDTLRKQHLNVDLCWPSLTEGMERSGQTLGKGEEVGEGEAAGAGRGYLRGDHHREKLGYAGWKMGGLDGHR